MIIYNARIAYYMYINIKVQIFSGGGSPSDFFSRCGRWGGVQCLFPLTYLKSLIFSRGKRVSESL